MIKISMEKIENDTFSSTMVRRNCKRTVGRGHLVENFESKTGIVEFEKRKPQLTTAFEGE